MVYNSIDVNCRKVAVKETKFYSYHETFFSGGVSDIIKNVSEWFNKNIKYYEKKDDWERKTIPVVSSSTFIFFLLCTALTCLEKQDKKENIRVSIEINDDCVYISGANSKIDFAEVTGNDLFLNIWKKHEDNTFDLDLFLSGKFDRKRIIFVYNSIYLNYKDRIRGKKFYMSENERFNEKELLVRDILSKYPMSSSLEISKYSGIPQRTVRYYLNKMKDVQPNNSARNSPQRVYSLNKDESATTRQKKTERKDSN